MCPRISAYFQCVYLACGPVENFTFVCVHSNEMSNHARKACTSAEKRVRLNRGSGRDRAAHSRPA